MCGIYGTTMIKDGILKSMSGHLKHRGPESTYSYEGEKFKFGINRLATIGKDVVYPLTYNNRRLMFNGDIYNYKELRKQLIKKGHKFRTDCDGEVIIIGYDEWGTRVLDKLEGQFAIIIYDENDETVFLARDRFGICPLYFSFNGDYFHVSSEIKGFKGLFEFNLFTPAEELYYAYDCVPAPWTLIDTVFKLEPGFWLRYNLKTDNVREKRYWTPIFNPTEKYSNEITYKKIKKAVELSSIADYPVATYLSGGVDSSTVTAFMSKINPNLHTFSVHFDYESVTNELHDAEIVAKEFNTKHHTVLVSKDDVKELGNIIYYLDEPIPNITVIAQYKLSQRVREEGIKIVLDGSGGDELFGGYTFQNRLVPKLYKFRMLKPFSFVLEALNEIYPNKYLRKAAKIFPVIDSKQGIYHNLIHKENKGDYSHQPYVWYDLFNDEKNPELINQIIEADIRITLSNQYLHNTDRMGMANGVVTRVPLLNTDLAEYAFSLPTFQKNNKIHLKDSMTGVLPKHTRLKKKSGFVAPLKEWWPEIIEVAKAHGIYDIELSQDNYYINKTFQKVVLQIWKKRMGVKE